jgi:hypothetical protein
MDNFELKPEPKLIRKPVIWNILTIVVLIVTCGLAYYFLSFFINPASVYNPFPPAALPTLYQTPTPTSTIILQPATWTPTRTIQPSPTRTKVPTWTMVAALITPSITMTPTETSIADTATISPTPMPATAEITYVASTTIHADSACKWMGVGGKVMDADNKPLLFQTIQLGGKLNGKDINLLAISGKNPAYGTSGFEFDKLSDQPVASTQMLWIQLFDNNGTPLTEKIYFDTYPDCGQNLVMVVFTKTR